MDGGFTWSSYCRTAELADHHILFVVGGGRASCQPDAPPLWPGWRGLTAFAKDRKWPIGNSGLSPIVNTNSLSSITQSFASGPPVWSDLIHPPG